MSLKKFKTMDGNEAAAYISYAFTEVATIYPITPSSPMADHVDEWAAAGMKNIFGQPVKLMELQAESGACGAAGDRILGHHLHRLPGPAADDPAHVPNRGLHAARCHARLRPDGVHPRPVHLRRPL